MGAENKKENEAVGNDAGKKNNGDGGNREIKITEFIAILLVISVVAFAIYSYARPASNNGGIYNYPHIAKIAGVDIYSEIPLSEFRAWNAINLIDSKNEAVITCNYELSAIYEQMKGSYTVHVEYSGTGGETVGDYVEGIGVRQPGIYISKDSAYITGNTDGEILNACHAFICLKNDMECPDDFSKIPDVLMGDHRINEVLDSQLKGRALEGVVQLGYALGAISVPAKPIYTYMNYGGNWENCSLYAVLNSSGLSGTNSTEVYRCDDISGIHLMHSNKTGIKIEGDRVILFGDDNAIYVGAIIVRDVLAPDLRIRLGNMNVPY